MIPGTPGPCFEDLYELDHVISLLREDVSAIESSPGYDPLPNGVIKPLLNAIEAQKRWQRDENDKLYPGAFDRSCLIKEYQGAAAILEKALWNPKTLPANLNDLSIHLYRLMIVGNMPDEQLRKVLSALADAEEVTENLKKPAATGQKIIDGGNKGNRGDSDRDKKIFDKHEELRNNCPKKLVKQIQAEVGRSFGIGAEAVKKAVSRHKKRNTK